MTNLFIFCSFFFPRITLFVCWLCSTIPINDTPFALDLLAFIVAPRLLIAWWMFILGMHPLLIMLFVLFGVLELFSSSSSSKKKKKKKKKKK